MACGCNKRSLYRRNPAAQQQAVEQTTNSRRQSLTEKNQSSVISNEKVITPSEQVSNNPPVPAVPRSTRPDRPLERKQNDYGWQVKVDFISSIEILKATYGKKNVLDKILGLFNNQTSKYHLILSVNSHFEESLDTLTVTYKYNKEIHTVRTRYGDTLCIPEIKTDRLGIVLDGEYLKETLRMVPDNIWPIVVTNKEIETKYFRMKPHTTSIEGTIHSALLLANKFAKFSRVYVMKDALYPEDHFKNTLGLLTNKSSLFFNDGFFLQGNLNLLATLRGEFNVLLNEFEVLYKKSFTQVPPVEDLNIYDGMSNLDTKKPVLHLTEAQAGESGEYNDVWGDASKVKNTISKPNEKAP